MSYSAVNTIWVLVGAAWGMGRRLDFPVGIS